MKNYLIVFSIFVCSITFGQNIQFQEKPFNINVPSNSGWIAPISSDFDNDGDLDIFVGQFYNEGGSFIYLNNGDGSFIVSSQVFEDIYSYDPDIKSGDFDNDGDSDIIIMTQNDQSEIVIYYYLNDGNANFTMTSNPFSGFQGQVMVATDIDNDNDIDFYFYDSYNSSLYLNNGTGVFVENVMNIMPSSYFYSINFKDLNNDGFKDILTSGIVNSNSEISTFIYLNDGNQNFTNVPCNIADVNFKGLHIYDLDSDSDLDVIVYGQSEMGTGPGDPGVTIFKYFVNDGTGNFSENTNPFSEVISPNGLFFNDIDNDNDIDLICIGNISGVLQKGHLFENINGSFQMYSGITNDDSYIYNLIVGNFDSDTKNELIVYNSQNASFNNSKMYDVVYSNNLRVEVFANPVSSLDTCDGIAIATPFGGLSPYTFDWFTQTNNNNNSQLDSICEGFHTLKIYDALGDSASVDYYVTDSANWYDWYDNNATFVDTIYMADENCIIDMNAPIDSTYISDFYYLYTGNGANEDYYYLEISYTQAGTSYIIGDTVLMELNGVYLIDFSIYCPTKSTSRIKTIVTSLDFPTILSVNQKDESLKINLYPNPTSGDVTLNLGKENTNATISIVDITGKVVFTKHNIIEASVDISLQNLSSGLYFVRAESEGKLEVIKLIKE